METLKIAEMNSLSQKNGGNNMYECMIAQGFCGKQKKKKSKPRNGRNTIHEYLTYKLILLGVPDENISFSNDL